MLNTCFRQSGASIGVGMGLGHVEVGADCGAGATGAVQGKAWVVDSWCE